MKKITSALLTIFLLMACQSDKDRIATSPLAQLWADSTSLKVALMPTADCLPFYYAEKMGYYQQLGLDVRFVTYMAQIDCDTAFINKRVDVCYSDVARAVMMRSKDKTPLYIIMQADGEHKLMAKGNKNIKNFNSLKERRIAVARHSVTDFYSDAVMDKAKMQKADIFRPQINDIKLRADMMLNSTMDAAFLPEPQATRVALAGDTCLFTTAQPGCPKLMAFIAQEKVLNNATLKEQVKLLILGYNQAVASINANEHQDSVRSILTKEYELSGQVIDSLRLPAYNQAQAQQQSNVEEATKWLRQRNVLPTPFHSDNLISTVFIP